MNDIIVWIATHNTLLIKIGFSAVSILIIAYVFRFFFMPRPQVAQTESTVVTRSENVAVGPNVEELAELQTEIDKLKQDIKKIENEKKELQKQISDMAAATTEVKSETVTQAPAAQSEDMQNLSQENAQMTEKIQQLEARLTEYEIISEDIAEVAQLKQENAALKSKVETLTLQIERGGTAVKSEPAPQFDVSDTVSESDAAVDENSHQSPGSLESEKEYPVLMSDLEELSSLTAESSPVAEQVADGLEDHAAAAGTIATEEAILSEASTLLDSSASEPQLVIQSETEVTTEEKQLINEFETYQSNKKGSAS